MGRKRHSPVAGSQPSCVQASPSPHGGGVPTHCPLEQVSPVVQRLPSSQGVASATGTFSHCPENGSQRSKVHEFRSSQLVGVPWHPPLKHRSCVVQLSESEHWAPSGTGGYRQPRSGSHVSVVQRLLSKQKTGPPPAQTPFWHTVP